MIKYLKFAGILILLGFVNTIILLVFEWIVADGTQFIWNDIFKTNEFRLLVIPLAAVLGVVYSWVLLKFGEKRVGKVHVGLVLDEDQIPTTVKTIAIIFLIGAVGLLAGASLGPEAVLFAVSAGIGVFIARSVKDENRKFTYQMASIGALFVAFLGSLIPIFIPILLTYQKEKKLTFSNTIPLVLAGFSAYYFLLIFADGQGFGKIPIEAAFRLQDIATAFVLGILGAGVAVLFRLSIKKFTGIVHKIDARTNWIISALIFGLVLGILYFIGGEYIQFSGREGSKMLMEQAGALTLIPLVIITVTKILATAWSLSTGYRGGIVFPSICIGVALALTIAQLGPFATSGMAIGAVSGVVAAMSSPILALILVASIVPTSFLIVAVSGTLGAFIGVKLIDRFKLERGGE